jgi:hypothetical protein
MRRNIQTLPETPQGVCGQGYAAETRRSDVLMGLQLLSNTTSPDTPPTIGNLGEALLAAMKKETTP